MKILATDDAEQCVSGALVLASSLRMHEVAVTVSALDMACCTMQLQGSSVAEHFPTIRTRSTMTRKPVGVTLGSGAKELMASRASRVLVTLVLSQLP